jgi:hypothetical protein
VLLIILFVPHHGTILFLRGEIHHDKMQQNCTNYPYLFDDHHQGENQYATSHEHAVAIVQVQHTSLALDRCESSADSNNLLDKVHHIEIHFLLPCM